MGLWGGMGGDVGGRMGGDGGDMGLWGGMGGDVGGHMGGIWGVMEGIWGYDYIHDIILLRFSGLRDGTTQSDGPDPKDREAPTPPPLHSEPLPPHLIPAQPQPAPLQLQTTPPVLLPSALPKG
mgnify:CR=1 FL=1